MWGQLGDDHLLVSCFFSLQEVNPCAAFVQSLTDDELTAEAAAKFAKILTLDAACRTAGLGSYSAVSGRASIRELLERHMQEPWTAAEHATKAAEAAAAVKAELAAIDARIADRTKELNAVLASVVCVACRLSCDMWVCKADVCMCAMVAPPGPWRVRNTALRAKASDIEGHEHPGSWNRDFHERAV